CLHCGVVAPQSVETTVQRLEPDLDCFARRSGQEVHADPERGEAPARLQHQPEDFALAGSLIDEEDPADPGLRRDLDAGESLVPANGVDDREQDPRDAKDLLDAVHAELRDRSRSSMSSSQRAPSLDEQRRTADQEFSTSVPVTLLTSQCSKPRAKGWNIS